MDRICYYAEECMHRIDLLCMHEVIFHFCISLQLGLLINWKYFVERHQPTQCCGQEWQWGAGSLDYWWMWHYPCCQEGKEVIVISTILVPNASKMHLFLLQNNATDLFSAACSGNIDLFDLLVERFDLSPDQWREVSNTSACGCTVCHACIHDRFLHLGHTS